MTLGSSCCSGLFGWIAKPDGSVLGSKLAFGRNGGFLDTLVLPVAGSYAIVVDPNSTQTGSITITAYDVPADATGVFTPASGAGHSLTFTTTILGQNVRPTFQGVVGQRISVNFSSVTLGSSCCSGLFGWIAKPDGGVLGSKLAFGRNGGFLDTLVLPVAGSYAIVVDPDSTQTGSITITAYDVPADATAVFVPASGAGQSLTFTTTTPGQNVRPTFQGVVGQRVSVNFSSVTLGSSCCSGLFGWIAKPDGSVLGSKLPFGRNGGFLDTLVLPVAGGYSIVVDPNSTQTGSITITAYDVPPDVTGTAAINGSALPLTIGTPGQNAITSFFGDASRPITVSLSSVTIGSSCCGNIFLSAKNPDGSTLISKSEFGRNGISVTKTLPSTGTYTLTLDPEDGAVGSAVLTLRPSTFFQLPTQTIGTNGGRGSIALSPTETFADPVNSLTGAYTASVSDLSLPSAGVAFDLTRSYTSTDATQTRLGIGWTDTYSASLTLQPNGDLLAHGEEGQQVRYARQQDGTFVGAPGALSTLSAISGGYKLLSHEQVSYSFDSGGRLQSVLDRNGQGVTLSYNGNGNLAAVTDAAGRVASFSSNPDGTLAGVSLPDGRNVNYGYSGGRLTSFTDPRGKTTTYSYDASGKLATEVDPNGHTVVSNVYGADGRVSQQTDASGNSTNFSWDAATQTATATDARSNTWKDVYANNVLIKRIDALGNVTQLGHDTGLDTTSVSSPDGSTTSMSYDSRGNMLAGTAPASLGTVQKSFVYDARNNLTSSTDPRGIVTNYTYDAAGNLIKTTQAGVVTSQMSYDSKGSLLTSADALGNTTTYTYDVNGNQTSVTDPLGKTTSYAYDAAGHVLAATDPRGNVTSYAYDSVGHLLTATDPLGNTTSSTFDSAGNQTSVTDAKGHITSYVYDAANRLVSQTVPDGGVSSYTFDAVGNRLGQTDALGHVVTNAYNVANQLVSVTSPLGKKTAFVYDANGNRIKVVAPRGNVAGANPDDYATTFTHDAAGRVLTQTDPLGNKTTYTYDKVGNRTSVKDANNRTTSYAFDGRNQLISETAPDGGVTSYAYDAAANLLSRTDANGHVTSYGYDATGRRTTVTSPTGQTWTSTYDAAGNLSSETDARGRTAVYTHDAANRLTRITYSDGTPTVQYAYDAVGERLSMTDDEGTQTYVRDAADRLTGVTRGTDTFSYGYDLAGNLASRTYPEGTITAYSYDADNALVSTTSAGQTTSYAYDADGRLTQTVLPAGNGHTETRSYDRRGGLVDLKNANGSTVLSEFSYTRDAVGNPTAVVRSGTLTGTSVYAYDANGRITSVCFQGSCPNGTDPFVRWTYDKVGNRLTEARPSGTTTYAYNAADQLTSAGSTTYSYDTNGNEAAAGNRTFSYDAENHLISTTAANTTTTYRYDGDGNRLQASTGTNPAAQTNYLWDTLGGLPQIAQERDGSNNLLRSYLYGASRLAMVAPSGTYYYGYDGLGSVTNLTTSGGTSEWTYDYEPFGTLRTATKDDPDAPANSINFTGEYLDPIGLYNLRAREYDPASGRFLGPDPLEASADNGVGSQYIYANDDPTAYSDPSGEGPISTPGLGPLYADRISSPGASSGINRALVWAYLKRYAEESNSDYHYYGGGPGGDCTNFASQALFAGGWQMTQTEPKWNYTPFSQPWYALGCWPKRLCSGGGSRAWIRGPEFVEFAQKSGRAAYAPYSSAAVGDIVVGRLEGPETTPDHLSVVDDVLPPWQYSSPNLATRTLIWSSQHSPGRFHTPLFRLTGLGESKSTYERARERHRDPRFRLLHVF